MDETVTEKRCYICKVMTPREEFTGNRNKEDGLGSYCKRCSLEKSTKWRAENPEKASQMVKNWRERNPNHRRNQLLTRKYGIDLEDYDWMFEQQEGKCAICGAEKGTSHRDNLFIDHIEGTLIVRGLLCSTCNSGIGFLNHSTDTLKAAIAYLESGHVLEGQMCPVGVHRARAGIKAERFPRKSPAQQEGPAAST